jgi:hypothetical protein
VALRVLIRAGLACLLGVLACNTKDTGTPDENQPVESLAALSAELSLQFPGSSRLIGVKRAKGIDDIVQVKLELAAQDLASLVDQTQIDPGLFFPGTAGLLGSDRGFWDPNAATALRTGQAKRPGGRALNLGVDDSRPDVAVVYIVEHGT